MGQHDVSPKRSKHVVGDLAVKEGKGKAYTVRQLSSRTDAFTVILLMLSIGKERE
jgi:hypothetical protein